MIPPPPIGDPYQLVPQSTPNPGSVGAALAWDQLRIFYSQALQQAWSDMDALQRIAAAP